MSPLATVCHRHQALIPVGSRCPRCVDEDTQRRNDLNREVGRSSTHWRRLSETAIALADGVCPDCRQPELENDAGSKLTCDLVGGGDHSTARLEQTRVRCRRCHGKVDGGRRR